MSTFQDQLDTIAKQLDDLIAESRVQETPEPLPPEPIYAKDYYKIKFTSGLEGEGYQVCQNGCMQYLTDIEGNILDPAHPIGYHITGASPEAPEWA